MLGMTFSTEQPNLKELTLFVWGFWSFGLGICLEIWI
jgi:hypothetical protein